MPGRFGVQAEGLSAVAHRNQTAPVLYRTQALDLVRQLAADQGGERVRRVLAANAVSLAAVVAVVAVLVDRGSWKPGGWTGYYGKLEGRRRSYRTVRRAVRAARALGLLEGEPPPPEQDDDGEWRRAPTTLRMRLPEWATARYWQGKTAGPPSGQYRTASRVISKSSSVPSIVDAEKPVPRARAPVDNHRRAPLPADYTAAVARLGRR